MGLTAPIFLLRPFDLAVKSPSVDAKYFGRTRHIALAGLEYFPNVAVLHLGERGPGPITRPGRGPLCGPDFFGQILQREYPRCVESHGAFDYVLELPDVTRP